jgi:hypothetical protein
MRETHLPISNHDPSSVTRKKKLMVRTSERVEAMIKREKGGRFSRWLRTVDTAERATKGVRSLKRRRAACGGKVSGGNKLRSKARADHWEWSKDRDKPVHGFEVKLRGGRDGRSVVSPRSLDFTHTRRSLTELILATFPTPKNATCKNPRKKIAIRR